jgi:hypothetical protein
VVRLNKVDNDAGALEALELHCHALVFADCTAPPVHVVQALFTDAEDVPSRFRPGDNGSGDPNSEKGGVVC